MLVTLRSGSTWARRSELRLKLHSACLGLGWHTFHQAVKTLPGFRKQHERFEISNDHTYN